MSATVRPDIKLETAVILSQTSFGGLSTFLLSSVTSARSESSALCPETSVDGAALGELTTTGLSGLAAKAHNAAAAPVAAAMQAINNLLSRNARLLHRRSLSGA